MLDLMIWDDRREAISHNIENLLTDIDLASVNGLPHNDVIKSLLQNLQDFGAAHFRFFYDAFTVNSVNLEESKQYSKPTVLNWITTQIAYDLSVISQAWEQRQHATYQTTLRIADEFALYALCPAKKCGFIDPDTMVLTYFQKSYSVRLVPYANVALIGIPFSTLTVHRDFLAIPHEVAHYVFRHGTIPDKQNAHNPDNESIASFLKRNLSQHKTYLQNWIEEMFADMYGCVVAGPVMALDFQDLQMDDLLEEFADARIDYEDPVPLVRPDTYAKVLAKTGYDKWARLAPFLHRRWQLYRNKLWNDFIAAHKSKYYMVPDILSFIIKEDEIIAVDNVQIKKGGIVIADTMRSDSIHLTEKPFDAMITLIWNDFISKVWAQVQNNCNGLLKLSGSNQVLETLLSEANFDYFSQESGRDEALQQLDKQLSILYTNFADSLNQLFPAELVAKMESVVPNEETGTVVNEAVDPEQPGQAQKKKWENWKDRWEKRNRLKPPDTSGGKSIQAKVKPGNNVVNVPEQTSEREWGWVELAYANGWVTRGPEPNPPGDKPD